MFLTQADAAIAATLAAMREPEVADRAAKAIVASAYPDVESADKAVAHAWEHSTHVRQRAEREAFAVLGLLNAFIEQGAGK